MSYFTCQQFFREAFLWSTLDHTHVLPLLGISESIPSVHGLIMVSPWMNEGDLRHYLKRQKLTGNDFIKAVDRCVRDFPHDSAIWAELTLYTVISDRSRT